MQTIRTRTTISGSLRSMATGAAMAMALLAMPARADWNEATTDNFVVVSGGSRDGLIRMAQELEAVHWLIGEATRTPAGGKADRVRIYLVDDLGDVNRAIGLPANSGIAGFYTAGPAGAYAVVPRSEGKFSTTVLFHEYAHHFMMQYMPRAYPTWYVEGFAELMGTATPTADGKISYGRAARHRVNELQYADWVPMDRMMAPPSTDDGRQGRASYGQYWITAHYLTFSGERPGQLRSYVEKLNSGASHAEAAKVFGDLKQLNRDVLQYARDNRVSFQTIEVPPEVRKAPVVRALRPGEEAAIDLELQGARDLVSKEQAKLVQRTAALAAQHPNEAVVLALHAKELMDARSYAEAATFAARAHAVDPSRKQILALQGLAEIEAARAAGSLDPSRVRQSRALIIAANKADPSDPVPLMSYHRSFVAAGEPVPAIAVDGLMSAVDRRPQAYDLRTYVVEALVAAGRLPEARAVLLPMTLGGHLGRLRDRAVAVRDWIDAGAEGTMPKLSMTADEAEAVEKAEREKKRKGD